MTAPDVQNVPDVWALLEQALKRVLRYQSTLSVQLGDDLPERIEAALSQRDRFVLVPKKMAEEAIGLAFARAVDSLSAPASNQELTQCIYCLQVGIDDTHRCAGVQSR